ncbi:ATP-binding protein, partial [bacterium]|nr:ATP-binding protein [bacterium]
MIWRNITDRVEAALADTPVVFLGGARQTGKSTLAQAVATKRNGAYLSLDDATVLAAASADPQAFLAGLPPFAVIDEVQKAPALHAAIKFLV